MKLCVVLASLNAKRKDIYDRALPTPRIRCVYHMGATENLIFCIIRGSIKIYRSFGFADPELKYKI